MINQNLEPELLKNLAFNFYPKNLSPENNFEAYLNSPEFESLVKILSVPNSINDNLNLILQDAIEVNFEHCTHDSFLVEHSIGNIMK